MDLAGADPHELLEACTAALTVEEIAQTRAHARVVGLCTQPQEIEVGHVAFEHRRHDPRVVPIVWQVVDDFAPLLSPLH